MNVSSQVQRKQSPVVNWLRMAGRDLVRNRMLYLVLVPTIVYYLLFCYQPMYGAQIAFKNFSPGKGISASPWVGFDKFIDFFGSYYFFRLIRNTVLINVYDLIFGFPAPILLALFLNEVNNARFKKLIQTTTYLPHFISTVVICGLILDFTSREGLVNAMRAATGALGAIDFMTEEKYFRGIYVGTGIWQQLGWGSIIYLAALSGVDPELHEAAKIDGAGKLKQVWHVTLPSILPTIIIMLIMRMGRMMNVGQEKILLLYNPAIYETSDVISTFVYRKGLVEADYSYSTAIGLFNSTINFALLILTNKISRILTDSSLW